MNPSSTDDAPRKAPGSSWAVIAGTVAVVALLIFVLTRGNKVDSTAKSPPGDVKPIEKPLGQADAEALTREQIRIMNMWADAIEKGEPVDTQAALKKQLDDANDKLDRLSLTAAEREKLRALDAEFEKANARLGRAKAGAKRP